MVQVLHGILDPLLLGIDTDFLVLFGVESVGEKKILRILFEKCACLIQNHLPWDKGPAEGAGEGREEGWDADGEWLLVMNQWSHPCS